MPRWTKTARRLPWSGGLLSTVALTLSGGGLAALATSFWSSLIDFVRRFYAEFERLRIPLGAIPVVLAVVIGLAYYFRSIQLKADTAVEIEPLSPFQEVPLSRALSEQELSSASTGPGGVHIWRTAGVTTVSEPVVPEAPSLAPPPPTPFLRNLLAAFALFVVSMMVFRHAFFYLYDRVVQGVSIAVYWPLGFPSEISQISSAHTVPDYIFLVYFAFILAFLLATGILSSDRFSRGRVRRVIGIAVIYPIIAVLLDVFFFTVGEPFSKSAALLLRGIVGGVFVGGLILATVELPRPVHVRPMHRAEPGIVTVFFLAVITAVVLALALLYFLFRYLGLGRDFVPIGILLLLPLFALTSWALIGRSVYNYYLRKRPIPPVSIYHPPVSIIIPAYNEAAGIALTIRSADAAAALYPGSTEILVGNDGSTDRTLSVAIQEIRSLRHATGAVIDLPHGGKANVLNSLLRLSAGEIVIRIDADTQISTKLGFSKIVPHFSDPDIGGVQGLLLPLQQTGWTSRLRFTEVAWNHLFLRPATMGMRACQVIDGAFSACRRVDLLAAGGWVNWNGEDTEVTLRLQRQGFRMRLETGAAAFEDVPSTYAKLERQRIRWSRGGIYAHYRHFYASFNEAWAYGGLAMLYWIALFIRAGLRSGLYVYVVLAVVFVPTILHLAIILLLLLIPRGIIIAAFMIRYRRARWIPWIVAWPVFSVIKQQFAIKSWGTMLPGEAGEFV
jgi:cellulose synthase/poly-beta-1,6-N-acetylglucosamine synthase-like glycosyltransferase